MESSSMLEALRLAIDVKATKLARNCNATAGIDRTAYWQNKYQFTLQAFDQFLNQLILLHGLSSDDGCADILRSIMSDFIPQKHENLIDNFTTQN